MHLGCKYATYSCVIIPGEGRNGKSSSISTCCAPHLRSGMSGIIRLSSHWFVTCRMAFSTGDKTINYTFNLLSHVQLLMGQQGRMRYAYDETSSILRCIPHDDSTAMMPIMTTQLASCLACLVSERENIVGRSGGRWACWAPSASYV